MSPYYFVKILENFTKNFELRIYFLTISTKCAKDEGHSDVANYFFMRAKTRVQMMNEDHQKMEELIKKEEMESGKSYEEGKWDCMHEYFMEEKEELEYAVQNFKM